MKEIDATLKSSTEDVEKARNNLAESKYNASVATLESDKFLQKVKGMEQQLQAATATAINVQAELSAVT